MDQISDAARLNNEGVHHIAAEHFDEGVINLTKSIKILKQELNKIRCDGDESEASDSSFHFDELEMIKLHGIEHDHYGYLFDGLTLLPHDWEDREICETDIQLCSAAVVLNLALVHHRLWVRDGSQQMLTKTLKLYQTVLSVLIDHPIDSTSVTIRLAAVNNLSQIQLQRGEMDEVSKRFHHLSSLLHANDPRAENILMDPEIQDLLMNVLLLQERGTRVAAAA